MSTVLEINTVIRDTEVNCDYRILWISPEQDLCYWIDIGDKSRIPCKKSKALLLSGLADGKLLRTDDPYSVPADHSGAPDSEKKAKERRWDLIKDAVMKEPEIYERVSRAEILKGIEKDTGVKMNNLYKFLGWYWKRGKNPNALYSDRSRAGRGRDYQNKEYKALGRPRTEGAMGKILTDQDRRNFSAAVSRFYLTRDKLSFKDTYQKLLNEYYTVPGTGKEGPDTVCLLPADSIPSFRQFQYWYQKNRDLVSESVKRNGQTAFDRTGRSLTGAVELAYPYPGAGYQLDATIADIYLVDEEKRDRIVGRPVLYFVVDSFSRMVTGMHVTLCSPSWQSAVVALENTMENKKDYCARYGIGIDEADWPCMQLPEAFIADRGEMESRAADCLVNELGIRIENTPPYRGDLKPVVEQHFRLINLEMSDLLPGKVKKDFGERGSRDYRLDACLDIRQFTRIIIKCVLFYNRSHYLKDYTKTPQMRALNVRPVPSDIWNYGIRFLSGGLATVSREKVRYSLLPKENASITEKGICFHGLFYSCEDAEKNRWFETARALGRESVLAAYDPGCSDCIYILSDNGFLECRLLEKSRGSAGRSFAEIDGYREDDRREKNAFEHEESEAHARLDAFIESEKKKAEEARPDMSGKTKAERLADIHGNRRKAAEAEKATQESSSGDEHKKEEPVGSRKPSMIQSMLRSQLDKKRRKD